MESAEPARLLVVLDERPSLSAFPALDATGFDVRTEFFAMSFTSFPMGAGDGTQDERGRAEENGPEKV